MSDHRGPGQVVGYARVSSTDQNLDRQLEALQGVDKLYVEKVSAKDTNRPELQRMLDFVREGDVIKVKSPDRLARSVVDLLTMVEDLGKRGVKVQFLDAPELSTDSAMGEFVLTIFAGVAQMERKLTRERQREGIALAKAAGKYEKAPKLTPAQVASAREQVAMGVPKSKVARDLGVSRSTLYAALEGRGKYAES